MENAKEMASERRFGWLAFALPLILLISVASLCVLAYGGAVQAEQVRPSPTGVFRAASSLSTAASPAVSAGPDETRKASLVFFVHLGDIWRYDASAGTAGVVVPAQGRSLGHVSWSLDGNALAWEERSVVDGRLVSKVVFRQMAGASGADAQVWQFAGASSPVVSPDGRYLLYNRHDGPTNTLVFFDSAGGPVPAPLVGACNGAWAALSDGAPAMAAFERPDDPQASRGFYLLDLQTGRESLLAVADGEEAADGAAVQRGRWRPVFEAVGGGCLVSRYGANGHIEVARVDASGRGLSGSGSGLDVGSTAAPVSVLDVTNADHFDYRWLESEAGLALPLVEVAPMAVGRSDIHQLEAASSASEDHAGNDSLLTLLDSSFGWNASLPAEVQFTDLSPGQPRYEAAALLYAEKVITGFADARFGPDEPVKRAQFAKMLVGAIEVDVYEGIPRPGFVDVGGDVAPLYPVEYVAAAAATGLVRGFKDGRFRPWETITRAQMISMAVRAAGAYLPQGLEAPPAGWTGETSSYDDSTHGANVHLAEYAGLLSGIDLRGWDLRRPALRGEVAEVLSNLLHLRSPVSEAGRSPAFSLSAGALREGVDPGPEAPRRIGNIVFDGDSLTAGSTATDPYPSQVMREFRPEVYWINLGIGGQKLYTMLENAPKKVDPLFQASLGRNVCVIWGGTNDIRWWGHTPPAVYQHLKDYCLGRRAKGFTVIVLTLLPRTDGDSPGAFEQYRQDLNDRIREGWIGFADGLVDVGADPFLGIAGRETDTRFYSPDRVHLNNNGLALVAGRVLTLLRRVDALAESR